MPRALAVGDLQVDVSLRRPHERQVGATEFVPVFRFAAMRATADIAPNSTRLQIMLGAAGVGHDFVPDPEGGAVGIILFQMPRAHAPEET